jgi:hypothetical protein
VNSSSYIQARISAIFLAEILAFTTFLSGQSNPIKIALSQSSTVPAAFFVENFPKVGCPNVLITIDVTKADYVLEAQNTHFRKTGRGDKNKFDKSQYTLFGKDGTAVSSTQTSMDKNSVKDVCKYLTKAARDSAK